jgi:Cadherin domain/RTX calcium-binding nonapeptide repeat (4 copies)/Haemolysin-type calcium binding protein related domain
MANPITTYYDLAKLESASVSLANANGLHGYDPILRDSKGDPLEFGGANTNAIAHTLSSAYLAYDYSGAEARILGYAREYSQYWVDPKQPAAWDTFKDLYNNQVGRNIAAYALQNHLSRDQIQDLVLDALSTGKLIVTQQDPRIDPSFNGNPFNYSTPGGDAAAWSGPSGGFADFSMSVVRVTVASPNGSGNWTMQPTGMDIVITQLAPNSTNDNILQARVEIDNIDKLTQVDGTSANRASVETVFDVAGSQPWSSETTTFDAYQRLQSLRVEFDDGGRQLKLYDPDNTHPYNELDITENSTGKPTAAQMQIDGQNGATADFSSVGQVLGSALGRALAPNNQFVQIAAGTVIGAVGQKLAQAFAGSLAADGSKAVDLSSAFSDFNIAIAGAGASSIASFLVAELGTELHLNGFGAQLFGAGFGGFTGSVASQIAAKMATGVSFESALAGVNFGSAATSAAYSISSAIGGYLAHELVPAQTHEGAVGGQLLGAIGSAVGISIALTQALGTVLNFIVPGIGSLIGTIVGTLIGDAVGSHPHPAAVDLVDQAGYLYGFSHSQLSASDGGDYSIPDPMATAADSIINAYLHAVNGAGLDHSKQALIGYTTNPDFRYLSGVPGHPDRTFITPDDAVHAVALDVLQHTEVVGGDLLMKRAHQDSPSNIPEPVPANNGAPALSTVSSSEQLVTMGGDLSVAQDYENYLNNREAINAVMATNPNSAFTAGWIATFARVNELGLNHSNASDFLGGLVGWLDSVKKAGLVFSPAGVTYGGTGSTAQIDIKVNNGTFVPGALSAFADQFTETSDATGTTLHFTINNGFGPLGFVGPSLTLMPGGWWQANASPGNNVWFGTNNAESIFTASGSGNDILIGGSTNEHIHAGDGWNFVDGGAGSDWITGGSGNDILHGGPGGDLVQGGGGDDTYTFNRGDGGDVVDDDSGADVLSFGPGVGVNDIALWGDGQDLMVGVRDPANPNVPFLQLTDSIRLRNWADPVKRVETLAFADGTTLSIADGNALAALRVPLGATLSHNTVSEISAAGTVVGTVAGIDLDADPRLRYTMLDGAGERFTIDPVTGVLTVTNGYWLDYEAAHSYQVTVRTTDRAGLFVDRTFTIAVTDVNEVVTGNSGDNTFVYPGGHFQFNGGNGGVDTIDMSHFGNATLIDLNAAGTQVWTTDAASLQQGSWWRPLVDLSGGVENAVGANANTSFTGDAHDNRFTYTGGRDSFEGGAGTDTLDLSHFTSAVAINLNIGVTAVWTTDAATLQQGSWRALVDLYDTPENFVGANANTSFTGDAHDNRFTYVAGRDSFEGGGGTDTLDMSHFTSAVAINLNIGTTAVWTTDASTLQQGSWRPLLDLYDTPENFVGASANTSFTGDAHDNRFTYVAGRDSFEGGAGIDTLDMSHFTSAVAINLNIGVTAVWTTDAATLQQGSWRPLVDLYDSVENFVGASANTSFTGDAHDNRFTYTGGRDSFEGGAGSDTLDMSHFTGAVAINLNIGTTAVWTTDAATLQQGSWRALVDLYDSVENFVGAASNTSFTGDSHDNTYTAGPGNDFMSGGGGHDNFVFRPGYGRDIIDDFASDDIIQFDHSQFADFAAILGHTADDGAGNTVISVDADHSLTLNHVLKASLVASEFHIV